MKPPKTIKSFLRMAANMQNVVRLKGYESLSENDKSELREMTAMISNQIGELSPELQKFCDEAEEFEHISK